MQLRAALLTIIICGFSALAAQTDIFTEPSSDFTAAIQRLLQDELHRRQGLKVQSAGELLVMNTCVADHSCSCSALLSKVAF
jgi:hypothetical protein